MKTNSYPGINIQFPISRLILQGAKTIETRTYPIPKKFIGQEMVIIETPGKRGKFKARMIGLIVFGDSFKYESEAAFYNDLERHHVSPDSIWAWQAREPKWGWPVIRVKVFAKESPLQRRPGIKFARAISIGFS